MRRTFAALITLIVVLATSFVSPATPKTEGSPVESTAPSAGFSPTSLALPGIDGTGVIDIVLWDALGLAGYELDLSFDPEVIVVDRVERLVGAEQPPVSSRSWGSLPFSGDPNLSYISRAPNIIGFGAYSYGANPGRSGVVPLARLHLRARSPGGSPLDISRILTVDTAIIPASPATIDSGVSVGTANRLVGHVDLQGREDDSGVQLAAGAATSATASDGAYALWAAAGLHTLRASRDGYLPSETSAGSSSPAPTQTLPNVTLLGGDINADMKINLFDLVMVASHYNEAPGPAGADVNGNGRVDIFDLAMVGLNYGREGVQPWSETPGRRAAKRPTAPPMLALDAPDKVSRGQEFIAVVRVNHASGLRAADVRLSFDPKVLTLLSVEDPGAGKTAADRALFPSNQSFVARNHADAKRGVIEYGVTLLGDAPAAAEGTLLILRFRAQSDTSPAIRITSADLVETSVR